ncbi:MAG: 4-hydroxy-tetrahydrodipicolinate reductase, partial [Proteobacteria bacterium]|nr:4-hydroxy-tetrahydrodipicolinate reductase [Pseudomonadota bacterium]
LLWGGGGQMGHELKQQLSSNPLFHHFSLIGEVNSKTPESQAHNLLHQGDFLIDFSHASATAKLLNHLDQLTSSSLKYMLIGTTGLLETTVQKAQEVSVKHGVTTLIAPNTSLGIMVLYQTIKSWMPLVGSKNFDVELVEYHHNRKHDAPSGTAKLLLSAVTSHPHHNKGTGHHPAQSKREKGFVGAHAVRGGGVFGEHQLHFLSEDESLTIKHSALSRSLFAKGALVMADKLTNLSQGFYQYQDLSPDFLH